MIYGVGTDLCPIVRMEQALQNPRFALRMCTDAERERMDALCESRRAERMAGLFAAKEAVAKALGTGFLGFGPAQIEVLADKKGKPCVFLRGGAAKQLPEGATIHLSVSHDGGLALAFAVIEIPKSGESEP